MRVSMFSAGIAVAALGLSASAVPLTVSSTVDQSGFFGTQNSTSYPITPTLTGGYNYSGQGANAMTNINSLTITVNAINDGDIGPGDYDINNLFLGVTSIPGGLPVNTGIVLTTLASSNGNVSSLTVTGTPNAASIAVLLAALQSNTPIFSSFIDTTPLNSTPVGDSIGIGSIGQTTLTIVGDATITAVPLPAAAIISPLGVGLAAIYARRFRRR
jgi:hypothetical protein